MNLIIMGCGIMLIGVALFFVKSYFDDKKIYAYCCGHMTNAEDFLEYEGERAVLELKIDESGETFYCHKCLQEMTIKCAWCGKPIFVGAPVTLYKAAENEEKNLPVYAVLFNKEENTYLGCWRKDCCEKKEDIVGQWHPDNKVYMKDTLKEVFIAANKDGIQEIINLD
jgi:hypothetical protein